MASRLAKKKPRMKTAGEVVKRILWDESLPPEGFIVGYLDRFIGVLERPFPEFSWDFAAADPEDPAIPEHRIEYFRYKSRKVWEKSTKLDLIFGSVGPADQENILDIIAEEDGKSEEAANFEEEDPENLAEAESSKNVAAEIDVPKVVKYAVILSISADERTSEQLVTEVQEFLISDPTTCENLHRLSSQRDLHLTLAVFETNQDPRRIVKILQGILGPIYDHLEDHRINLSQLCLLKDTVVAAKITDHHEKLHKTANFLKESLKEEDFTVHDISCLHVTLARLKKPSDESVTTEIESKLEAHPGFTHDLYGNSIVAKKVGVNEEIWRAAPHKKPKYFLCEIFEHADQE